MNNFKRKLTMKNYLLEVGTENLPVDFLNSLQNQLTESLSKRLQEERLAFKEINIYSTPRRIGVIINGIAERQTDETKIVKGPPAKVAFKDNKPTAAAEGFAKKCNISINDFGFEKFDNIEYIVAEVKEVGMVTEKVLASLLPGLILSLKGSHFMRWEDLDVKFSRPIRWITSIMDNNHLPITIANINSTDCSYGHRFLAPNPIRISSPEQYMDILKEAYVIVDPEERKKTIEAQIKDLALKHQSLPQITENLLGIVNNLVEWPVGCLGKFDAEYLHLPDEVITTVMAVHQKYFPLYDIERRALLNYFVCITNKNGSSLDTIVKGNQRVLKARLEDASFYYNEDIKKSLYSRVEVLKGMTFQKNLGNMYQKMDRIRSLAVDISKQLKCNEKELSLIERTAILCKADLASTMVREFTELEGKMGSIYALNDNEDILTSQGIAEHYLPKSTDDILPKTITGKVVSIADKLDTIVGVFSIDKAPTGSADPLGLRRAALGILMIVINCRLNLDLSVFIDKAYDLLGDIKRSEKEKVVTQVKKFLIQRLRVYFTERNYRYDVIEAVLSVKDPLTNLLDMVERLKLTNNLVNDDNYTQFHESANRILRIIKNSNSIHKMNNTLFVHNSEHELYKKISSINIENSSYQEILEKLQELTPLVDVFFDNVLVMDKDETIKNNRLSLLHEAASKYKALADFSKIVN